MAITCPVDLDTQKLRDEIRSIYERVADDPSGDFHFHRGAEYAADFLSYDRDALAALPHQSTASFAGVANPHRLGPIDEGMVWRTSAPARAWTCSSPRGPWVRGVERSAST